MTIEELKRALVEVRDICAASWIDCVERCPLFDHKEFQCPIHNNEIEPDAVTASGREVHIFRCSACDFTWANKTAVLHYFKHCPNCGARMDGEK